MTPERVTEALTRAVRMTKVKVRYKLGAGGSNPKAPTPLTVKDGTLGCDCTGFVFWALQLPRHLPAFKPYEGDMNTDSIIIDAQRAGADALWRGVPLHQARAGDVIVYPGLFKNGKRLKAGHICLVVAVPPMPVFPLSAGEERTALLRLITVVDCAAALKRRVTGYAIGVTHAAPVWDRHDALVLRYVGDTL